MSALEKVAAGLVAEVPIGALQELLGPKLDDVPVTGGILCGGGCASINDALNGVLCGFGCKPVLIAGAQGVVDSDGVLALTTEDLNALRNDLPKLRGAVVYQIEKHLNALK